MTFAEAVLLAIIEGLTEYLPISSTGHLIIASSMLGIAQEDFTKIFTVNIQFGAILSVVVMYWKRFIKSFDFYVKLFIAFLPAAVIGILLGDYIDQLLENVWVVAISMIAGGVILIFVDQWFALNENRPKNLNIQKSFIVGVFQCMALVPGVSRSAATIIGGLSQGLNRQNAAEFSFFLAVPTMFAASAYKLFKGYKDHTLVFDSEQLQLLLIGNLIAFIVAMLAIRFFINYLTRYGFKIFGYYRIFFGIILLILLLSGVPLQIV